MINVYLYLFLYRNIKIKSQKQCIHVLRTNCWAENLAIPAATMNGTQTVRIDFKGAKDCWFDLREESGTKQGTNSLRFSVAEESSNQPTTWELAAAPSTTSQAPSSTTNPTQSSSASSSPSPSPSPSSMPSTTLLSTTKSDVPISSSNTEKVTQATPSGQNTPSTQTTQPTSSEGAEINKYKIGLGVGIPVGCLLIAGVGVLAYMIRKRRSRNHRFEKSGAMGELPGSHPDPLGKQYSYIGGGTEVAGSQPHAVVELDLRSPPAELEASYKSIPR